ncbi:hypothetical protein CH63R_05020 [Colletotrichum higginsianum IMI 349063]|uniref:Uncharacterized protein n=1 Tax=Colletotrichum higginsianum (strain IMI 349063) TaxID=759273 RepID=A0A1B7YL94_COLHI|nr:hypothetical protein CH63R_05020 [Colletotrichum higginsianum IMI 349063]OBR12724.1 hypothetical protein CH63R_05020 [Colletotrichum higginsianum IMI 349063]
MDTRDWPPGTGTGAQICRQREPRKPLSWAAAVDGHPPEGMVMGGRVTKGGEEMGRARGVMHRRRGGRWRDAYSGSANEPIFLYPPVPGRDPQVGVEAADQIGGDGCARLGRD